MQNSRSAQRFVACFSLVFSFCVALLPGPARAQNLDARLVDTSLSPYGLIGVQTNRNLGHLELHGVLNFGYVNDPLVGQRGVRQLKLIGERMILEAGLVLGVIDRLEIGLALPIYLRQRADAATPNSGKSAGIGMLRFVAKGTILENRRYHGFGLGLYLDLALPTGTRNARMGETMIHGTPGLILDFRRAFWAVSLNLGYRFRKIVRAEGLVIDDEVRLGLGVEIPLHRDVVTLIAETTAAIQTGPGIENGDLQSRIPVELLGALRWRSPFGLILTLGAGFGATHGVTASDFRAFVSLGYGGSLVGRPRSRERDLEPTLGPTTRRPSPTAPTVTEPTKTLIPPFVAKRLLSAPQLDRLTIVDDDYDGDGIPLSRDKCPNEPEDIDGFEDDDGCPDPDNDHDGIPDHLDKCPNEPETINGFQDDDGCPDVGPGPRVVISGNQIVIKDKVYFDTGSDALKPTSHSILDQVAQILRANPQMLSVLVEGHTDNQGDLEMNVDLSQRRAQRVMAYLIDKGVERKRLKAKGFGPKIPVADNKDREGRAQNRRVAFKILVLYKAPPKLKAPPKPKAPPNSSGRLGGAR